ncbi:unnamed protein product [Staurois parvus]|uniref:Uncharacterized protein n=1 Tax=Staurois parvus TaxID=386267 RepID=A0ABN9GYY4_9NEOB|nr:unnamed protein product [Staurois parvus]
MAQWFGGSRMCSAAGEKCQPVPFGSAQIGYRLQ